MLSLDLAQAVRQQFTNPHRKQMIIELLGSQFKRSYLAEENDSPSILVFLFYFRKNQLNFYLLEYFYILLSHLKNPDCAFLNMFNFKIKFLNLITKHPPLMNEDQRKKLENEAKSWLQIQINEIALRKGCALRSGQKLEF
jgi:hypothetical protein